MKRNAIARVIIFSILALVLISALMSGIGIKFYHKHGITVNNRSAAPVAAGFSFDPQEIHRLKIDWVAGRIHIETADTNEITVSESSSKDAEPMVLKKDGSTLIAEYCQDAGLFSINVGSFTHKDLYITVPQNWTCRQLEVDAASADVEVLNLSGKELDVDTASGSHRFDGCNFESMKMDSASGALSYSGCLEELNFSSASGRANISLTNQPESIKMDSLSGDLNLTLPSDCGFTLDQDSLSGSKKVEFDTQEKGDRLIHGDGACEIKISGLSANVHIHKGT